jgi:Holliday junction resolvase
VNKNKRKGTAAETAFVKFMNANGFPLVERRALQGKADRGDISGLVGVVIEIKSGARLSIPEWLKETQQEQINDGASESYLIVKPKGKGKVEDWWVITTVGQWLNGIQESADVASVESGSGQVRSVDNV